MFSVHHFNETHPDTKFKKLTLTFYDKLCDSKKYRYVHRSFKTN